MEIETEQRLSEFMVEQGFIQSKNDPCLYHKPAKLQRVELEQKDVAQELVAQGYIQSNKDSTMYYYPGMTVSTHVDDLITRYTHAHTPTHHTLTPSTAPPPAPEGDNGKTLKDLLTEQGTTTQHAPSLYLMLHPSTHTHEIFAQRHTPTPHAASLSHHANTTHAAP